MGSWQDLRKTVGTKSDSVGRGVRGWVGVRVRLLSIVLISSVTLLAIGGGAAVYLVKSSREATQWAELASSTTGPAILMVSAFQQERRLSLLLLAGDHDAAQALVPARQRSDAALAAVQVKGNAASDLNPDDLQGDLTGFNKVLNMVPQLRKSVDSQQAPAEEIFGFFTAVVGTIIGASMMAARVAPNAKIGIELGYAVEQLRAAEALSQSDAIGAVGLITGEFPAARVLEFGYKVGEFRSAVVCSAGVLQGKRLAELQAITASAPWQQLVAMQDAIVLRGPFSESEIAEAAPKTNGAKPVTTPVVAATPLPSTLEAWQEASDQVNTALQKVWEAQSRDAHAQAHQLGEDTTRGSMLGGAVVLLIAALAFLAALVLANRFIGRMRRLRNDTLELANERMPDLIQRLGAGEELDASAEVSRLDFGTDELGHVADAFNQAHVVAVSAAVAEAKTRAGINAVFLNIAHRSQVVVHRQLALLDRAERQEENADQLELLFQLDHLATRARRNAENLIILGGEQPGRRWRNPVALFELVRGAVAESLDYTRIEIGRMPDVRIASHAVADLIHLIAELTDNATACSPPETQVLVTGMVVGRGVVVDITDHGLGMSETDFAERNAMLANPPDFSVATLSGSTRLGLFVVAKLAGRHGVSVRLAESLYGGVQAVVLIPRTLMEMANPHAPAPAGISEAIGAVRGAVREGRALVEGNGGLAVAPVEHGAVVEAPNGGPNSLGSFRSAWLDAVTTGSLPTVRPSGTQPPVSRPPLWETETEPNPITAAGGAHPDLEQSGTPALPKRNGRPVLPRRNRPANSTSPVRTDAPAHTDPPPPAPPRQRTAEEARNLMSAIAKGTRQGRQPRVESEKGPQ